jgi:O-Antigen ligase
LRREAAWRGARLTVPGATTAWLAFHAGGFFAGEVGLVTLTLAVLLVGRVTLAERPFAGWSVGLALVSGALAAFGVWILASAAWSHAPARAMSEFDRVLLYGFVLMMTSSAARRRGDVAVVMRVTGAALAAVAVAGLLTRLLPATFPIHAGVLAERLSFPLTYWNAMGISSALGVMLALHLTASGAEPPAVRVLAAALLPAIAVALYFTFSRGAIWVLPVGLFLYVVVAQPRALVSALPAAGLPAALAVKAAYGADLLAKPTYDTSHAAASQGRHLALIVAACVVAAGGLRALGLILDRRVAAISVPRDRLRVARVAVAAGLVACLVAGALVAHAPRRIADAGQTFSQGHLLFTSDLRHRLTSAVDNGRVQNWRVALDAFRASPLHGTGAGTYRLTWERDRTPPVFQVSDGHSLYLETLSEMGVPGLVLVVLVVGTLLAGSLRGLGGPERHAYAALLAAGTILLIHAGVDWDWEMPALFAWFFGAGGVALSAAEGTRGLGSVGRVPRILAALAVLVLAITPWLEMTSQSALNRATRAFAAGDCPTAVGAALDAVDRFGVLPGPWEILAYCDERAGQYALATRAMDAAHARDPRNWAYVYGQALVHGVAGQDPRPYARAALRMNRFEPLAQDLVRALRKARTPARRRLVAARAGIPFQ